MKVVEAVEVGAGAGQEVKMPQTVGVGQAELVGVVKEDIGVDEAHRMMMTEMMALILRMVGRSGAQIKETGILVVNQDGARVPKDALVVAKEVVEAVEVGARAGQEVKMPQTVGVGQVPCGASWTGRIGGRGERGRGRGRGSYNDDDRHDGSDFAHGGSKWSTDKKTGISVLVNQDEARVAKDALVVAEEVGAGAGLEVKMPQTVGLGQEVNAGVVVHEAHSSSSGSNKLYGGGSDGGVNCVSGETIGGL